RSGRVGRETCNSQLANQRRANLACARRRRPSGGALTGLSGLATRGSEGLPGVCRRDDRVGTGLLRRHRGLIMRLLVDVSAGQAVTECLRRLGHEADDVRERDPTMADVDILSWAVAEQRLVVTMDKDFGELVYRSGH